MKQQGIYIGAEGKLANYDIQCTQNQKRPLVVFCHGFNGFKDWGAFNLMADYFVLNGFQFVKFNFSHNGTSPEHPMDFVDLEAFGRNNFEKELLDIEALIVKLKKESFADCIDFEKLFLIGHSKGGATALAYTLAHPKISTCATLAGVLDPIARYGKAKDTQWKEKGVKFVLNGRTNQKMPMYYQLVENTQKIKDKLDIRNLLKSDKRKFLFIQGGKDEAVPVSEVNLVKNLPNCTVFIIEDANHVFGASHPYTSSDLPDDLQNALSQITKFFASL
ncbi:alpha/beta hydrolase family protein [Flavobacterium cellulosilyticum]|uniref:Alpha/beta fold hydrolase n=1 Tax=Flavobacterium cellulosilyticum TaxID=2541731 RepID=A0A4V6PF99_9FLAO|nr:alpha/beta fold hydrolase [Flavobacterium cellulosilyticum]TDD96907.1 alpha/beta fold hydrolase [Flavobacterium cellulosilyticum]